MQKIKGYSLRKRYSLKIKPFYYNPITLYRSCCIPDEEFIPFDIAKFNFEFEKRYGLLNVSEESEPYSYS